MVAKRLNDIDHLFVRDEPAAMNPFVVVDRHGKFASLAGKLGMSIGELTAFDRRLIRGLLPTVGPVRFGPTKFLRHRSYSSTTSPAARRASHPGFLAAQR